MLDMYALPITLRYKNQSKFFTNAGALTSLCIYITLIGLLSSYLSIVFNKDPDSINS